MARRFRGTSTHKVDSKGRVSIPAAFRRVLEENDPDWQPGRQPALVLLFGDERVDYIEVLTRAAIERIEDRIDETEYGSEEREELEEWYCTLAAEGKLDDNGRMVLPRHARDKIGLKGEALFVATGESFRIWDPDTYAAYRRDRSKLEEKYGKGFHPAILLSRAPRDGGRE